MHENVGRQVTKVSLFCLAASPLLLPADYRFGTMFSGTPGPIPAVTGARVCNPGTDTEVALNTGAANPNARGDTQSSGRISNFSTTCSNPLLLLRISKLPGANGKWIATGTERAIGTSSLSGR